MLPLLHSPAEVLRSLLIIAGVGSDPGSGGSWPVYTDLTPDLPDRCLVLKDAGGAVQGRTMQGEILDRYGVGVLVRAATFQQSRDKGNDVRSALKATSPNTQVNVDGAEYLVTSVTNIDHPRRVGRDGVSRLEVVGLTCMLTLRRTV